MPHVPREENLDRPARFPVVLRSNKGRGSDSAIRIRQPQGIFNPANKKPGVVVSTTPGKFAIEPMALAIDKVQQRESW